jgi:HK97 family phage prohead protease
MFDLETLQVRTTAATVEEIDEEAGLVEAKLAAYEETVELEPGLWEVFSRGAFAGAVGNPSRVKVTNQGHDRVIIGHATELRDEDDGLYGRLKIPDTSHGRDVLTLLREGTLVDLSVEFRAQRRHVVVARRETGGVLVRHNKATLTGISPVGAGAYGDKARVLSVREAARDLARDRALAHLATLVSGPTSGVSS